MLVFTSDLEQVEEVCGGGVDGDKVFVGLWGGRGEVEDFEIFGALGRVSIWSGGSGGRGNLP